MATVTWPFGQYCHGSFVHKELVMLRRTTVVPAIFAGVFVLMTASCGQGTSPTANHTPNRRQ